MEEYRMMVGATDEEWEAFLEGILEYCEETALEEPFPTEEEYLASLPR